MKNRFVILNAENFKQDMALQDNVFPLAVEGHFILGSVFSQSDIKS